MQIDGVVNKYLHLKQRLNERAITEGRVSFELATFKVQRCHEQALKAVEQETIRQPRRDGCKKSEDCSQTLMSLAERLLRQSNKDTDQNHCSALV